jgi:phospholipase C
MVLPFPDPGEPYPHVTCQLFGDPFASGKDAMGNHVVPAMSGFVADYILAIAEHAGRARPVERREYEIIMRCYPPEAVPVLTGLARDFAVCDEWFCSVPSQTFCNRSFAQAGTSHGFVLNAPCTRWLQNTEPTIFNLLSANRYDWRVYWDQQDLIGSFTRTLHPTLYAREFDGHFRAYGHSFGAAEAGADQFREDCAAGNLPAYTFIEPRFFLNHNDMHPPVGSPGGRGPLVLQSSILAGDLLIHKVYEDLFVHGAARDRTLLIVTFDEHGGCYDHVAPPSGVRPPHANPPYPGELGFRFDRLGVRVPAVFVSPWIEAGTVLRAREQTPFDHTSIIRTICRRWNLTPNQLTDRDQAAPDVGPVLNAAAPRREMPRYTPRKYVPVSERTLRVKDGSALQRSLLALLTTLAGTEIPHEIPVEDALWQLQAGLLGRMYELSVPSPFPGN